MPAAKERLPSDAFGLFDGRAWLNAAHQGPLPRVAAEAAEHALAEKMIPSRLTDVAFVEVPERLRAALARLVGGAPDEIVLGNSASYGLDVLARGLRWRAGDEVLLPDGEFPASVFPWRVLERLGVQVRLMPVEKPGAVDPQQLASHFTDRTRLFCASWVNSFTGTTVDIDALGRVCRAHGVWFVLNASQALGARALDVRTTTVDALTCCGYKWLLGPYGTGFLWLTPTLRDQLEPLHAYWLPNVWGQPGGMQSYTVRESLGVRALDISCPANFLNFVPWTVSIEYLLDIGVEHVEAYDQTLVARLVAGVGAAAEDGPARVELLSPAALPDRSTLVVARPTGERDARMMHEALTTAGIDTALREGAVRLSPHLYNTVGEIDRAVAVLTHR
jgi:selenocysteine lyase/cysteine desulfurase